MGVFLDLFHNTTLLEAEMFLEWGLLLISACMLGKC